MTVDGRIQPGPSVTLRVDGAPLRAQRGQTVAAALLAAGRRVLRRTRVEGRPRGLFCAMGTCFDCVMTIDGRTGVRACMTRVEDGMEVVTPARFETGARAP